MAARHLELTYPIKLWVLRPLGAAGDAFGPSTRFARSGLALLAGRLYALLYIRL